MFVYIFCIIWATVFVFLAERKFKKIPFELPSDRKKDGLLAKFLQRINKVPVTKRTNQPVTPIEKNWTIATPQETKHIDVVLDGNDEIAVIIPNVGKSALKPKKNSNIKHDIQKVRNIIIENNLPLNRGPASRKHTSAASKNIKVDFLDDDAKNLEETQEEAEIVLPKPSKRKVESKIIMDVITARKQAKNADETKEKILKEIKPKNNEPMHRRTVGDEIFREKKVKNIVQSARRKKSVAIVNDIVVKNKKIRKSSKNMTNIKAGGEDEK